MSTPGRLSRVQIPSLPLLTAKICILGLNKNSSLPEVGTLTVALLIGSLKKCYKTPPLAIPIIMLLFPVHRGFKAK